ncbi:TIGR04282 family arsenosugar biosynthesis glycosyltransferase [Lentisphaera profundi]|uniref:TIGR04282 family arsenosugar biosynthesis glycosyltransferase n=1 Tax=Lentisphaera profundi TaxID=1658616 RepID=A0ABY7VW67_9BACT|nr:TIGR04282 family arsenosugar biosynthesis glycosyltransferase [Lentisphaera profundi]WDE98460.1 TIGR04282 family arsenosugar biosynthesis glycosyltransferase [Lentisphaera profundi]
MNKKLIIFAKAPVPGKVKSRLGKSIGMEKACDIYRALLDCLISTCQEEESFKIVLYVAGSQDFFKKYYPKLKVKKQSEGDLGNRIHNAFKTELNDSTQVALIGSDCPLLSMDHIQEAYKNLTSADLTIGPAKDGGYYLMAMNQAHQIFDGITWSSELVLKETLALAEQQNLNVELLETLSDLDTEADLKRHQEFFLNSNKLSALWPYPS